MLDSVQWLCLINMHRLMIAIWGPFIAVWSLLIAIGCLSLNIYLSVRSKASEFEVSLISTKCDIFAVYKYFERVGPIEWTRRSPPQHNFILFVFVYATFPTHSFTDMVPSAHRHLSSFDDCKSFVGCSIQLHYANEAEKRIVMFSLSGTANTVRQATRSKCAFHTRSCSSTTSWTRWNTNRPRRRRKDISSAPSKPPSSSSPPRWTGSRPVCKFVAR